MAAEKSSGKSEKKHKSKSGKSRLKDDTQKDASSQPSLSLLANENAVDSKLSSLFAVKPVQSKSKSSRLTLGSITTQAKPVASVDVKQGEELDTKGTLQSVQPQAAGAEDSSGAKDASTRKRKRKDRDDDLEDKYMRKLAKQDEHDHAKRLREKAHEEKTTRIAKLQDGSDASAADDSEDGAQDAEEIVELSPEDTENPVKMDDDPGWKPPQHESVTATLLDVDRAGRTAFIGNVSIEAVTSKAARKTLEKHLTSFFDGVSKTDEKSGHKLESLRFRSTPYDPSLPKKAAFAKGEVMATTTQSTNAYAVYSSPALVRAACRKLNGSVVLDRHIRVDSVAHPAPVAHKRCVFVGNLGFVDDETNIIAANEAEGREKRKQNQKPSDVEEGLWRLFAKHGTVESVRVIRDKGTRVGKGIAYVQFTDENAVEGALSEDGKKDPPRLPRRLRVTRAKAMKRSKSISQRPSAKEEKPQGYRRKITPGEATLRGRVGKLMGKAAAAMAAPDFKRPEAFVFEGHRASSGQRNTGLKLGKGSKRKTKPTGRSARRTAAFKAGNVKKKGSS